MPVFHVYLNGKKVSTAGVGDLGVLGAHVSWVRRKREHSLPKKPDGVEEELTLHVGGFISPAEEHVRWLDRDLKIGERFALSSPGIPKLTDHAAASGATALRSCARRSDTS